jgi:peroxiredoxin Q/BCP
MASTDDHETNTKFAKKNNANFPILSDPDGLVASRYGVRSMLGFAKRWTFYIDKDGRLVKVDKKINLMNAGEDIAANLIALNVERRKR